MSEKVERLKAFVDHARLLDGDEKGEAQVFCDRLFQAFGHDGYKEAGATLERRIKRSDTSGTSFADLVWPGTLLLEMKKRGAKLSSHYKQAFDYWIAAVPNRPRYVVLCNFDEFWIYDFDTQIDQPVDIVKLVDLPSRYAPLNFLFPDNTAPVFGNDRVAVTREAADQLVTAFNSMVKRGEDRGKAQRFILQMLLALFAEDLDLLPNALVASLLEECRKGRSTYDVFGGLFRQMNNPVRAAHGQFAHVAYFNGGLFSVIEPIEANSDELHLLSLAATQDWSKVNPAIFGTIFQHSMDAEARHAYGAHYTSEADILRVVLPTITRPWQERIRNAATLADLVELRKQLTTYRVLDPACGSGNFLYVAYREMVRLEVEIVKRIEVDFSHKAFRKHVHTMPTVSLSQLHGIELNPFGVELAKVTLMLAKKLGIDEAANELATEQEELGLYAAEAIPLDNLDANVVCDDALVAQWPPANAIIGNPPYQSKNKIQRELSRTYVNKIRKLYPQVPGRADFCVYWFRKAHDHLAPGGRAGLVGTNTIRQNYSRQGGLDYIVGNGGTITEAVSTQVWSGDAVVHVSIVNWVKGADPGPKKLFRQLGDSADDPWEIITLPAINSALSSQEDVTSAKAIRANLDGSFQGQTHGHEGFLLTPAEAKRLLEKDPINGRVLFPFLITDDVLGKAHGPTRYAIDFYPRSQLEAAEFSEPFSRIEKLVLPDRKAAAEEERLRNDEARRADPRAKVNWHHRNFLANWWLFSYPRGEMLSRIEQLDRHIVCGRVTRRPIFEFVSPSIRSNDSLMVFPYSDDYSFGILQSGVHWEWFTARCSTLKGDPRYTSNTVFDSFPWPQNPTRELAIRVAEAAVVVRHTRSQLMATHGLTLRELYQMVDKPGKHPLKDVMEALDSAVMAAYGFSKKRPVLGQLLALNSDVATREVNGDEVTRPGIPETAKLDELVRSSDRIQPGSLNPDIGVAATT